MLHHESTVLRLNMLVFHRLLNGNDLTGTIPEELGNLRFLDRLQIDSNQISGSIPTTFQNLVSMRHL